MSAANGPPGLLRGLFSRSHASRRPAKHRGLTFTYLSSPAGHTRDNLSRHPVSIYETLGLTQSGRIFQTGIRQMHSWFLK
jgi:hypothetical protein